MDAVELTNKWPEYQEKIESTMDTIMEASDAVMIEAKGLPTRTGPSKPGETSKLPAISSALVLLGAGLGADKLFEQWRGAGATAAEPSATRSQQHTPSRTVENWRPMNSEEELIFKFGAANY
jgi:hypothetical protein